MSALFPNVVENWSEIVTATWQTLYMTFFSAILAGVLGLISGIALTVTQQGGIAEDPIFYSIFDKIINLLRSIPFVILMAVISPLTLFLVGTTVGETAALVPLIFGIFPFYARQIQNALEDIDLGEVEAAEAMGLSKWQIIFRVYLREGLADIVRVSDLTLISLVGLTTMAGAIGAGGLGDVAITVGYARFENDVIVVCMIIILVIVFAIQICGDWLAKRVTRF